jgi:NOL1/NOP2/sun family putative RNA methylase
VVSIEEVKDSALAVLAMETGHSMEDWFSHTISELPETVRLNPLRSDVENTRTMLEQMGAEPIPWFSGGTAYTMPWPRGSIPEQYEQLYIALHETGRTTRQEAVSMLPAICLAPERGERVLDLCAAPGSKTTQLGESMFDTGVLVANDVSSSRLNTLVSNRGRTGLSNVILTRHDGRHFPSVPDPGFDAILVDVPCTGSATMRKNKHVWWNWKPESASGLNRLQVDILKRACALLRPGGRLVYSTCSFDPVENEGVVHQILSELEYMELEPIDSEKIFPGLISRQGISNWENEKYNWNDDALRGALRIAPEDNDSGGFFLARLKHRHPDEDTARAMMPKIPREEMKPHDARDRDHHLPVAADSNEVSEIKNRWGMSEDESYSWWKRGKKYSLSSIVAREWLWEQPRTVKRRRISSGGRWTPLNVIHAGITAFQPSKGGIRPRSEARPVLERLISNTVSVADALILQILEEGEVDNKDNDTIQGYVILSSENHQSLPVWAGAYLTLMVNGAERTILLAQASQRAEDSS